MHVPSPLVEVTRAAGLQGSSPSPGAVSPVPVPVPRARMASRDAPTTGATTKLANRPSRPVGERGSSPSSTSAFRGQAKRNGSRTASPASRRSRSVRPNSTSGPRPWAAQRRAGGRGGGGFEPLKHPQPFRVAPRGGQVAGGGAFPPARRASAIKRELAERRKPTTKQSEGNRPSSAAIAEEAQQASEPHPPVTGSVPRASPRRTRFQPTSRRPKSRPGGRGSRSLG